MRWGFDGRVVPGRFNILSVLAENPENKPFDGALTVYRGRGAASRLGANVSEPRYLSPHSQAWVQFHVYVPNLYDTWFLEWGRRARENIELPQPQGGPPARVLLEGGGLAGLSPMKSFPEELFPVTVAGTEALEAVLVDHAPRMEPARRLALLDWVRAGGVVHVLQDYNGRYPLFGDDLAVFNPPEGEGEARVPIGAGLIVRHPVGRAAASDAFLASRGFPVAVRKASGGGPGVEAPKNPFALSAEESLFPRLNRMTRPQHNWKLIYGMIVVYILVIGPANYVLGRRARDYRWTLAFFLAAVAAFAVLFSYIGRRGYGESSGLHTVTYARPLGGGQWNVMQWSNAFVVSGAYYTITHPCPVNIYSAGPEMEAVNGIIQNGKDGRFLVDIPLFSSRSFMHRAKVAADDLPLKVSEWRGETRLEAFAVAGAAPAVEAVALYRGRFYPLTSTGQGWRLAGGDQPAQEYLAQRQNHFHTFAASRRGPWEENGQQQVDFSPLRTVVLARALGGADAFHDGYVANFPKDQVQVFLFARSPAQFGIKGNAFGRETGYTLYHLSFNRPEK